MKAEKWQFEYNNLRDKYEALQKEKEVSWWTALLYARMGKKFSDSNVMTEVQWWANFLTGGV